MKMSIDHVVPWGRNAEEYRAMFSLTEADLTGRLLGCADGPASCNVELTQQGVSMISVDPLYAFSADEIRSRIDATAPAVIQHARDHHDTFLWTTIPDVETLACIRLDAMAVFLEDYEAGRVAGRYCEASLPALPFADGAFSLALCSHFLFLYGAMLDAAFHEESLVELCRVADEVRVYPLIELDGSPSRWLASVSQRLSKRGYHVREEPVAYRFQRHAETMLVVSHPTAAT